MPKQSSILLPLPIIEGVEHLNFKPYARISAYRFLCAWLREARKDNRTIYDYQPIPFTYFRKVYGSRYNQFLQPLQDAGIVEVKTKWLNGAPVEYFDTGRCKEYRIASDYLTAELALVTVKTQQPSGAQELSFGGKRLKTEVVTQDLASLFVDTAKLKAVMEEKIAAVSVASLVLDEAVEQACFFVRDVRPEGDFEGYSTRERCLRAGKASGRNLIQDGNRFILQEVEEYLAQKRGHLRFSYEWAINALERKQLYANRNPTNRRLDHNLTSLSKALLGVILEDNHLVEIDVANCQFAILAHLLKKDRAFSPPEDAVLFCSLAAEGGLYEYIQQQVALPSRDDAKAMLIEQAFSKWGNKSAEKKKLKTLFPSVVKYIDEAKKALEQKWGKEAQNQFAIGLQREEARLFVDHIYYELKRKGFWLLTKHDSLLVRKEEEGVIRGWVEAYFSRIGFACRLK